MRYLAFLVPILLSGCIGSDNADLHAYVAEVKSRQAAPIEPIPEIKAPETYVYSAGEQGLRTPFIFGEVEEPELVDSGITPDMTRPREELESYSLDTLRMVGALTLQGVTYGLVKNKENVVFRVRAGNYMGRHHGKITGVFPDRIELIEIIPDRTRGYIERPASVALGN